MKIVSTKIFSAEIVLIQIIFLLTVTPGYPLGIPLENDPITSLLNHFSISFELQSSLDNNNHDNGSDETNREEEYRGEVSPIPVEHETREKQQTTYRWCQEAETVSSGDRGST